LWPGSSHVGKIELALDQAPRALFGEVRSTTGLPFTATSGRAPSERARRGDAAARRRTAARLALVGLHAQQEAVGRIRRRGAAPRIHQIVAREGEQQHRGQAEREARDLHGIAARMAPEIGEAEAQLGILRSDQGKSRGV
jgi:hypothetical protein